MPMLLVERGGDKGTSLKVEPGKTYVVGRDNPQAALLLTDPMASRSHFQIAAADGAFLLRDMKSRNGTLVNDEKLMADHDVELKIGDNIQVGDTLFSFLSDAKEESTGGGLIGKTIGGYQIIERVGRGGMGTVYKAEQISLKREVALKVLAAKLLSDPVFVDRFVQEARAAGGLIHPNIVQVIDVGSDRGIYYFSMEFMNFGSVGDLVAKEGPVPWSRALEMMTDAAKGLIFAEKKGIIHRDIKPDNLMLTAEGTVKIGDLGLAKKAEDGAGEGGQIFGTPHFIAPEQAQGKPIDHRADLYALGATFYRVLSGKTPFTGENVKEIIIKQVREEPVPLKKHVPDLPDEMAAVIGKMMQKKPDDRYRSAQGLFEDLERIRVRYHLEAHGQARSAQRNKVLLGLAVVALLGVGGYAYNLATRDPEVVIRNVPGENGNGNTDPIPVPVEKTLAEKAEDAWNPFLLEAVKVNNAAKGSPAETWQTHGPLWEGLAKKYEEFAAKYPSTPRGDEAAREAEKIRTALQQARDAFAAKKEKAERAWADLLAEARKLDADGHPAKAVAELLAKSKSLLEIYADFLPKGAEKEAADLALSFAAGAEARVVPLVDEVTVAAPPSPAPEYVRARDSLRASRNGLLPANEATDEPSRRLRELAGTVSKTLREGDRASRAAAEAALASDRDDYFATYLSIRRLAPPPKEGEKPGEEAPAPAFSSPFYDFQWDACDAAWKTLLGRMRTKPYQERVKGKMAQYARCRRVFVTIAARIRKGDNRDFEFPEAVRGGVGMALDRRPEALAKASPEGLSAIRLISTTNRPPVFVEFRQMTPREIYDGLQKTAPVVPYTAEEHLDMAVFLAESGDGDAAWNEYAAAGTADPPAQIDPSLKRWLEDECTLYEEFTGQGGVLDAIRQYREARSSGAARDAVEGIRRVAEKKIRDFYGQERFYRTDLALLLGFSLWESGDPLPKSLLPSSAVEEVLRTLGTGADAGAGEPGVVDPPPPEEPGNGGTGGGSGETGPKGTEETTETPK